MKAVVLLSGGLDSATNLYLAHRDMDVELALTFDYGQRASSKEISAASKLCHSLGISHKIISIPWVSEFGQSSLLDRTKVVPQGSGVQINSREESLKTAASVWVPNRNGIFLNIAAGYAESLGAELVVPGFNFEEAQTFPDNTVAFLDALTLSFSFSTSTKVRAHCFTAALDKAEMITLAQSLNLPFELLWPCYLSNEKWCGLCESCLRFKRGLEKNHLLDHWRECFQ